MTKRYLTDADWEAVRKRQEAMTPTERRAWLRAITGPPRRAITGTEYDHLMTVFALTTPDRNSNNQHTETDEYSICGKNYHVTYGIEDKPILEEILDETP